MAERVMSRHLSRKRATQAASAAELRSALKARARHRSSGNALLHYKVAQGFLHWKVVLY